jgi:putative Mg2+ transporter-C (MgtC) family protein
MRHQFIHDLYLFRRVALAALLGLIVGWEREVRGHPAGARTFALISAGAAALTAIGIDVFPATAEKMLAGIVTGIGFLGAGVLLREHDGHVRGLTTAAAIWAIATVGIIAGAARFVLATLVAFLFLVLLEFRRIPLLSLLAPSRHAHRFKNDHDDIH